MFLLAYQLSTRVLDTGKELIEQEITPRLQPRVSLRFVKPPRIWNFEQLNSAVSLSLQSWLSKATDTVKHALRADLRPADLLPRFPFTQLTMGNFQSDLQVVFLCIKDTHLRPFSLAACC
jgi:hypothetical protein